MEKRAQKNNYIWITAAVLFLIAMLAWAYFQGVSDGREHRGNRANQNAQQ